MSKNTAKDQYRDERVEFTPEMKEEYTILFPTMLPIHFSMLANIFVNNGYKCVMLTKSDRAVVDAGLENVHNDTCYPALLVIGQMMDALESGEYDINKVALLITQTGGGCRASNYIHLLRKAMKKRGWGHVPIISLNFSGMEKNSGFKITIPMLLQLLYAVLVGDLLMLLSNQTKPYEIEKGASDALCDKWIGIFSDYFKDHKRVSYKWVKEQYRQIIAEYAAVPKRKENRVKVGIVGEIFVKYSPLGNNNLEDFLLSEGAEVVVPGLLDFLLYCVENSDIDYELYGGSFTKKQVIDFADRFLIKKQKDLIDLIKEEGTFEPPTSFEVTRGLAGDYISKGVKMGEGWLLTAEMAELIHQGVNNIICTQPFGCLPNHIVAKGKMHLIKEHHPEANIVAIDYDPGATQVNQENRIKLMLSNAELQKQK